MRVVVAAHARSGNVRYTRRDSDNGGSGLFGRLGRRTRCSFLCSGLGKTRSSHNLLRQASLWADPEQRLRIVRRMYEMRFDEPVSHEMTLRQIRGKEGARVRAAYARASEMFGVEWSGRRYHRDGWDLPIR